MHKVGTVVLAVVALLAVTACEAPDEKPAQAALLAAKELRVKGEPEAVLVALTKVETAYPKTKAAEEARKVREQVKAELAKAAEEQLAKLKKENEEREARDKRIAAKIAESKDLLATLAISKDDMKGLAWHRDKAAKQWVLGKYLKLYFGINESKGAPSLMPLRMQLQYEGEDWIFARTLLIKVGGKVYNLMPENWNHENSGGTVWESCDVPLSMEDPELLAAIASADEVKVRFEGRSSYSDFIVPKAQLAAAKRVHAVWRALNDAGAAKP